MTPADENGDTEGPDRGGGGRESEDSYDGADDETTEADGRGGDALTARDRRQIREFVSSPPSERSPDDLVPDGDDRENTAGEREDTGTRGQRGGLTPSECRDIRESVREASSVREVASNYPGTHASELMRHARGECSCPVETPTTTSPKVQSPECRDLREAYLSGDSPTEIEREFSRSDNTVMRHVFGRCNHDSDPRDLSPSEVPARLCNRLRGAYRKSEKVTVEQTAVAVRLRPEVTRYHLLGFCSCEVEEDALDRERGGDRDADE